MLAHTGPAPTARKAPSAMSFSSRRCSVPSDRSCSGPSLSSKVRTHGAPALSISAAQRLEPAK
eukprot:2786765-Lingulodinium_polyedra.AAC.1